MRISIYLHCFCCIDASRQLKCLHYQYVPILHRKIHKNDKIISLCLTFLTVGVFYSRIFPTSLLSGRATKPSNKISVQKHFFYTSQLVPSLYKKTSTTEYLRIIPWLKKGVGGASKWRRKVKNRQLENVEGVKAISELAAVMVMSVAVVCRGQGIRQCIHTLIQGHNGAGGGWSNCLTHRESI